MILGLPAHPLIVHGAVVGIPLASLALLFYVARPAMRQQIWLVVAVTVVLAWLFSFFAGASIVMLGIVGHLGAKHAWHNSPAASKAMRATK